MRLRKVFGFESVVDLPGGMLGWTAAGHGVENLFGNNSIEKNK